VNEDGESIRFLDEDYSFPGPVPIGRIGNRNVAN
jgi:hypothetical protein